MTPTKAAEDVLVERLTAFLADFGPWQRLSGAQVNDDCILTVPTKQGHRLTVGDLRQAADAITTLLERERILTEALVEADAALESVMNDEYDAFYVKVRAARDLARAALTREGG